ncbi:16S rRNA (guanine(966)-N(2))-methyltransferase RsmD [bacterium]|nr:16S rRNA (guanine(966)-N(2))-methyltransferase RsmD [bacterium]
MLRILGGEARGRKLKGPKGLAFRPTTGRVKEFVFAILMDRIRHASVLDLFAGSGSMGIEALSRGAERVVMVESSKSHVQIIERNLETCRFLDRSRVLRGDVFSIMKRLGNMNRKYDIIIADPPFKMFFRKRIVEEVERNGLLGENGILLVEHHADDPDGEPDRLQLKRQRRFGHCMVSIYE